ncbi:hypothetical protein ACA910_021755 [Epithemia clementina (nom. ined.)]
MFVFKIRRPFTVALLLLELTAAANAWIPSVNVLSRNRAYFSATTLAAAAADTNPTKSTKDLIRQTDYLKNPRPDENKEDSGTKDQQQRWLNLLQDALSPEQEESTKAASKLIAEISTLRQTKNGETALGDLLNHLLSRGPDSPALPFWTRLGFLGRFSQRARWASLRRTLNLTTPPPSSDSDDEVVQQSEEERRRRRRRALVGILRTLSSDEFTGEAGASSNKKNSVPPILLLEQKAGREDRLNKRQRRTNNNRDEDLTLRRPAGLETPKYSVLEKKSSTFEIRRYEDFAVCSVSMSRDRPADSSKTDAKVSEPTIKGAPAFGALAGYLFGKNEQNQAMKMTTPVLTNMKTITAEITPEDENNNSDKTKKVKQEKIMSFVLPSEYWKNETGLALAPQPLEGSGVTLEHFRGEDRAVVMFGGYVSNKVIEQQSKNLLQQLKQNPNWQVAEGATVAVAQYNDPFTPPWKRLNEVSIAVLPKSKTL